MQARYRFGGFDMLPGTRRLMHDDAPVVIGARAFDLLQCLIECRERGGEQRRSDTSHLA